MIILNGITNNQSLTGISRSKYPENFKIILASRIMKSASSTESFRTRIFRVLTMVFPTIMNDKYENVLQ